MKKSNAFFLSHQKFSNVIYTNKNKCLSLYVGDIQNKMLKTKSYQIQHMCILVGYYHTVPIP